MRESNKRAVEHLLNNDFDNIWLKSHTRFNDMVYCKDQTYAAKDIWKKDLKQYKFLLNSGFKVIVLWENTINKNINICKSILEGVLYT